MVLIADSDFMAFCSDYFPDVSRCFSNIMERTEKVTLFLERRRAAEVIAHLREAHPEAVAQHEHLLVFC